MTDKEAIDNLKNYIECLMEDYGYYKDLVEFRDSVEHLEKSLQTQQAEIEKLRNNNKDLLRKLRNRVKEVKKLTKYSLYKKEFSTLNEHLKKKDKMIDEIQKEVRDHIGFENRLKRDNKEPDLFNQGRFYVANNINNILKGK